MHEAIELLLVRMGCRPSSHDVTECDDDKEDMMDVEDIHSVDQESKQLETGKVSDYEG